MVRKNGAAAVVAVWLCLFGSIAAFGDEVGNRLAVMTINLWHKDKPGELKIMAEQLRAEAKQMPDFVMCQEVVFDRGEPEDSTAAVLANYMGYHCRGTRRTSDNEGVAIVSRFPFQYYAERHLKSQTSPLLLGFRRVSVMGEFMMPNVGRVRVVNVHFTNWEFEHHVRRKQLAETMDWIAERQAAAPAAVTLLGGDFNSKRDWDEMKLLGQAGLDGKPAFRDYNSSEASQGSPGNPNKRIDYIFISATAQPAWLLSEALLWKNGLPRGSSRFFLSDHLALLHVYAIK